MKTLHLLRHAKSAWDEPGLSDHARGLNRRGQRDAPRMGRALSKRLAPPIIDTSSARRAQLTLHGLQEGWPGLRAMAHREHDDLYTFSDRDLLGWLQQFPDAAPSCFLIGHNPALTELINLLCDHCVLDNLPTAGYAEVALDVEHWADLRRGVGRLQFSLVPKRLPAADT
ncbi:MAG: histidine phosphatase family protein [Pseudomonadota bacterium]